MRSLIASLSVLVLLAACKKEPTAPEERTFVVSNIVWKQTSLDSLDVIALSISGTNLFAATNFGVLRSTDNGTSWTWVFSGLRVNTFAVSGSDIIAGGHISGRGDCGGGPSVLYSSDAGSTWAHADTSLGESGEEVTSLALLGTAVFAGLVSCYSPGGVHRSSDRGALWTRVGPDNQNPDIWSLTASETGLFAGTYDGVVLTTNNGGTWTAANAGLPMSDAVIGFAWSGTNILAITGFNGVFVSTNNGSEWTDANSGLPPYVRALAANGSNIFAGGNGGVFFSINNGSSWKAANAGLLNSSVSSLAGSGANLFAGTSGGGVFKGTLQ